MIGSFITRGLVMVLGYAYPAYECYKTVEKNKPEIEQLLFWCQYWILVAFLTVCERVGDAFISWVPMYSEVKLLFFIYLWHPRMKGTTYVYDSFFRPYLAKHENEIDRNLLELRTRAGDIAFLYWQRAASYGQTRIFDILQYVAAQSTPRPCPPQQQQGSRARQPPRQNSGAQNHQPAAAPSQPEEPPSPTSSTSSSQYQKEIAEELASSEVPKAVTQAASSSTQSQASGPNTKSQAAVSIAKSQAAVSNTRTQVAVPNTQKSTATPESESAPAELESMQIEQEASLSETENANPQPPAKETVMEDAIRMTRGRLRKTRSTTGR
ncbi:TB2/DP1/HVA22-related protein [Parasponia andersonii]|uniref:HVA22-like protein n=1 Tax=Parasponia andersonii TaxID=3476 RepID=A0A2P5DBS8_PARAD|nr:TB2/DP1/HVA22-related protein [Parasponia andersonii]